MNTIQGPTKVFRIAAITALVIGMAAYGIGLLNADMMLNEKDYYLIVLLYGLFSVISLQKTVRDRAEGIKTSQIYYVLSWASSAIAISLLVIGLYNAELLPSEKGFYAMSFVLSLFAAVTVQKNVRDRQALTDELSRTETALSKPEEQQLSQPDWTMDEKPA